MEEYVDTAEEGTMSVRFSFESGRKKKSLSVISGGVRFNTVTEVKSVQLVKVLPVKFVIPFGMVMVKRGQKAYMRIIDYQLIADNTIEKYYVFD